MYMTTIKENGYKFEKEQGGIYENICWQKMEGRISIVIIISKEIVQISEHDE